MDGVIPNNPTDGVKPPKRSPGRPNALTTEGRSRVLDFLDANCDTPVTIAARIALYCGLREGEICGLKWRDVEIETDAGGKPSGGTIWVRRSIGAGPNGLYVKPTKTNRVRDVPIPEALSVSLDAWRDEQGTLYEGTGADFEETYVIGDEQGFCPVWKITKGWREIAALTKVIGTEGRPPTFHDLRHTYATCAIAANVDVKTVSSILGHANAAMTLNIYASADPDAKRRAAGTVDKAMRGKRD